MAVKEKPMDKIVRFPKPLVEAVNQLADERGENFSVLVRGWVREGVERERQSRLEKVAV